MLFPAILHLQLSVHCHRRQVLPTVPHQDRHTNNSRQSYKYRPVIAICHYADHIPHCSHCMRSEAEFVKRWYRYASSPPLSSVH